MQDPDTVHCPYLWPYLLLLYEVSLPLLTGIILLRQWLRTSEPTVMEVIDLFLHPLRQQSKQTNKSNSTRIHWNNTRMSTTGGRKPGFTFPDIRSTTSPVAIVNMQTICSRLLFSTTRY